MSCFVRHSQTWEHPIFNWATGPIATQMPVSFESAKDPVRIIIAGRSFNQRRVRFSMSSAFLSMR